MRVEQQILMRKEAHTKFDEFNLVMNDTEKWVHRDVLQGKRAAFNNLSGTRVGSWMKSCNSHGFSKSWTDDHGWKLYMKCAF